MRIARRRGVNGRRRESKSRMMEQVRISLPDGSEKTFPKGTPILTVAESIGPRLAARPWRRSSTAVWWTSRRRFWRTAAWSS